MQSEIVGRKESSQRLRQRLASDREQLQREAVVATHEARATLERTMKERKEEHDRTVAERQRQCELDEVWQSHKNNTPLHNTSIHKYLTLRTYVKLTARSVACV